MELFSTSVEHQGATTSIRLIGNADLQVTSALGAFITEVHETVLARGATEVVVDFRHLTFMSSSCVKALVTWICAVQDLPPHRRYRIVLQSSPEMRWQRRSLRALHSLATELVTIQA